MANRGFFAVNTSKDRKYLTKLGGHQIIVYVNSCYINQRGDRVVSRVFDNIGVLIHTVDLEITQYMKNQLAPYQLAPEQYLILALLLEEEGMSQNCIARQLGKDKSSITRMIVSLEGKEYIRRVGCPNDRRCFKVYLTDKAKELREVVNTISIATRESLSKGLTEEETSELRRLLGKVRDNVRKEFGCPGFCNTDK